MEIWKYEKMEKWKNVKSRKMEIHTKNHILMICRNILTSIVIIGQPNGTKNGIPNFTNPHNQLDVK